MIVDQKTVVSPLKCTGKMGFSMDEDSDDQLENESTTKFNGKKRKLSDNESQAKKKGKIDRKDLFKQPTVEELNQLRETENLFHSNLFRLQIEEILGAVKIKSKYSKLIEKWFEKFKNCIGEIENTKEINLQDSTLFDVKIPIRELPNDCVGTFKFLPPSSITIGGSLSLGTIVGPDASIDVMVEMPESLFQMVDCKNYRYMKKKSIYLAQLASNINEELAESKSFIGNNLNPILKIVPNGKLSKHFVIYVHVVVQETTFQMNRFTAEKNNVRPNWFFKETNKNSDVNPSTPYYNNVVLKDLTALKTNVQNAKIIKEYPNIRDGIILLKIWLKQRECSHDFQSFNGHIITMCVLYLLLTKKLNTFMSSYQIVRNTWQFLASSDWCKEGLSICQDDRINNRIALYHQHYDCVFLDANGFHNLAANVFEDTFKWISHQAELSIECLNNTRVNSFQILFLRKVPFYRSFDNIICFHNVKAVENIVDANSDEADKLNYGSNKYILAVKLISRLLKQGLGNRVSLISILPHETREWNLNDEVPSDVEKLYFGLQLDPNYAFNIIEKGPSANLPEAEAFRKLWGKRSELRRFKDGMICEAVVWAKGGSTLAYKRGIPLRIAKFLLEEKLKLFEKLHFFFFYNQTEEFLKLKRIKVTKFRYGPEEAAQQVINTFDALEKELSDLTDVPLSISGVQGCNALFRYTEVYPPLASVRRSDGKNLIAGRKHLLLAEGAEEAPLYLAPVDVVLQLSTSGKWPDDLEALRMTKAAFNLQIAKCLRKQYEAQVHGSFEHVDVMKDGFVFRLRIAHQKEIGLIKQIKDEDGVIKYRDNDESIELEKQLFHLPRLTGALYGLHCQQPSFGPACCLAKRWLSAQLIDDSHMPDIAVELLMASIYLNPNPYRAAHAPQVAFLRFLESFAFELWSTDPIVVNFNNGMTREEVVEVENLFGTSRDLLPPLFISTPYDKQESIWTKKAPSSLILNRISSLAKEALRLIETQLFNKASLCCDPLFTPPLSEYDCIIQLKDSFNPRIFEGSKSSEELSIIDLHPYKPHSRSKIPVIGFDPVAEYLKELRSIYDDFALFFHDTYGGNVIGVLMKPQAYQEKEFKVPNTRCQKLNSNRNLVLNVSAMIEDFYILGKELVKAINVQSKKLSAT